MINRELSFNANAALQDLATRIKSFGEVQSETKPCEVVLTRRTDKQAQIMLSHINMSVEEINLKLIKTIITHGRLIYGCCMLPDGRMAFADYIWPSVRVFKSDGSDDFGVVPPLKAFDIAFIGEDNTLVVSSGLSEKQIMLIIDIQNKQVKKGIQVDSNYYGIAIKDGNVICSAEGKGIKLLNMKNNQISDIVQDEIPFACYVAAFGDKIYHTNYRTQSVTCYNTDGTVQWIFKNESVLNGPRGISVNNDGIVYVVGNWSDNVLAISADGQNHKEILTVSDGLSSPFALDYDRSTNQLLVANSKEKAMIYTLC